MTIPVTEPFISGPYAGNGVTVQFDYDFRIYAETELKVVRKNADDTLTVLALTTDYIVAGVNQDTGRQITLTAGDKLPTGATLTIEPDITLSQDRPFSDQTSTNLNEIETIADKTTSMVRQLKGLFDRTPIAQPGDQVNEIRIGDDGELLMWDANGNIVPGPGGDEIANVQTYAENAATSAASAATSATNAENSAIAAATSATNAENSAIAAENSAQSIEDSLVIVKAQTFKNSTEVILPNISSYVMWTFSYDKLEAATDLIIEGLLVGRGLYSYWMGLYVEIDGTKNYHGITVLGANNSSSPMAIHIKMNWASLATGVRTIKIGWLVANNTNNKPFANEWNPVGHDPRQPSDGTGSYVTILETR